VQEFFAYRNLLFAIDGFNKFTFDAFQHYDFLTAEFMLKLSLSF